MSQLNKVFQHVVKMFNYKTYIKNKGYFTANLINVFERYYNQYGNTSEVEKMDLWTDILAKWYNSYLLKLNNTYKRKLTNKLIFKCPELYKSSYEFFMTDFNYTIKVRIGNISPVDLHNETNFETLKYIHESYTKFISYLNSTLRDSFRKIEYKQIKQHVKPLPWYESKEILPGHYSDITKLNHHNRQYYRFHPGLLDLN